MHPPPPAQGPPQKAAIGAAGKRWRPERTAAQINLRNIRFVLARRDFSP
jgi:hypothetical protein